MKSNTIADKWRNEGNSLYKVGKGEEKFHDAIIAYNKSLCFSEPGSKQRALAYGNRSAVYLEIGLFDECLQNIQLALESNHPEPEKLRDRSTRCLEAKKNSTPDVLRKERADLFKLSYEPNKKYPSIVACLELRKDKKFGRYIVSNRDLKPGDIISVEEPVFTSIEVDESRYRRCILCLQTKKHSLVPCEGCTFSELTLCFCSNFANNSYFSAMFCSEKCKRFSMENFHGEFCKLFKIHPCAVSNMNMKTFIRFLSWIKNFDQPSEVEKIVNQKERKTVFDFDFSDENDKSYDLNRLKVISGLLPSTTPESLRFHQICANYYHRHSHLISKTPEISEKQEKIHYDCAVQLMLIRGRNAWGLAQPDERVSGLFMFSSLLNHACDSNVRLAGYGSKQVVFVSKPIKKNEQIFVKYG